MIVWRNYLARLSDDGVELLASESDGLDEDGSPVVSHSLVRRYNQRLLYFDIPHIEDLDDPVSPYLQRQIMNTLRLPPERYAFGRL